MLATPLISTILQHGQFSANDVLMTRTALVAYAVGLVGIILVKILAPAFYAQQNVATPVKIAIATLIAVQLFNLAFVPFFRHAGLALSTGLGACVNAGLLYYFLRSKRIFTPEPQWLTFFFKLFVAAYVMGCALWWVTYITGGDARWLSMTTLNKCYTLTLAIVFGAQVYFLALRAMGIRYADFSRKGA